MLLIPNRVPLPRFHCCVPRGIWAGLYRSNKGFRAGRAAGTALKIPGHTIPAPGCMGGEAARGSPIRERRAAEARRGPRIL